MNKPINFFLATKAQFDSRREWLIKNKVDYQWSHLDEGGYVIHAKSISEQQLEQIENEDFLWGSDGH